MNVLGQVLYPMSILGQVLYPNDGTESFVDPRAAYINSEFQTLLGRPPTEHEFNIYYNERDPQLPNRPLWDQNRLRTHILSSDEYYRKTHTAPFSTAAQDPRAFENPDYIAELSTGGEYNTQRTRQRILNWLNEPATDPNRGGRFLKGQIPFSYSPDRPGGGGLYDMIQGEGEWAKIHTKWGDTQQYPEADQYFSHGDLLATRAMGFSEREIQSYLDENMHVLREAHRPGVAGGVYEAVRSGTPLSDVKIPPPTVSREPNRFVPREPEIVERPERDSLTINPSSEYEGKWGPTSLVGQLKAGSGNVRRRAGKPRPKYTSTKDLSRERRNSLNIS